ncbi:MAG TPA: hypothetical protein VKV19_02740 [Ktedonobacteraceae bacterium]|nr:hypothetical protein [Ktedonobacteraceae bacterium]
MRAKVGVGVVRAKNFLRTAAVVLALPVREMNSAVVVSDEFTMSFLHLVWRVILSS